MIEHMGPLQFFVCGGCGGAFAVLVGHPLDTIKVRLQTMPVPRAGEKPLYSGTFDCFKTTLINEGVRGLYKGMSAPLVSVAPVFAISFMGYGMSKEIVALQVSEEHYVSYLLAGAMSGVFTTVAMAPVERVKCLLQVQHAGGPKLYTGSFDAVVKLYRQGGIRTIYKGLGATLARDIPAAAMYFFSYEVVQDFLTESGSKPGTTAGAIFAGGLAGIFHWLAGMPADVLKSRIQTAPEGTYPNGMRDAFKELMAKEGPLALYKGIVPVLLRAFPANAACFTGFELCTRALHYFGFLKNVKPAEYFAGNVYNFDFCLLQVQHAGGPKLYTGSFDAVVKLYRQGGIRTIYKGLGATLARDIPAAAMYFFSYEVVQDFLTESGSKPGTTVGAIFAGGLAGIFHWLAGMPADVLKSRIQTAPEGTYPKGMRDALKELMAKEGPLALYKGIVPVLLRAFPANAACFTGFELCTRALHYFGFLKNVKPAE